MIKFNYIEVQVVSIPDSLKKWENVDKRFRDVAINSIKTVCEDPIFELKTLWSQLVGFPGMVVGTDNKPASYALFCMLDRMGLEVVKNIYVLKDENTNSETIININSSKLQDERARINSGRYDGKITEYMKEDYKLQNRAEKRFPLTNKEVLKRHEKDKMSRGFM